MYDIFKSTLAAEKVLKRIINQKGKLVFPINPHELLKENGVIITYSDFDNLEGLLLFDEKQSMVSINMNRPITRQRFTAAHELGHIILHSKVKTDKFFCPITNRKNDIEKEADNFASNLLMPSDELNKQIDVYQNKDGKVGLDACLLIAEHFGVSFEACVKTVCFRLRRFEEELDNEQLTRLIRNYKPDKKRRELFENTDDLTLLTNAIDYSYFSTLNLNKIFGIKFVQNMVYHESRLENNEITQEQVNGVFADLRVNGNNSMYCEDDNRNIIEALGNIEMNKYCLETSDNIDVFKLNCLNKMLYKYTPYPDFTGSYRTEDNIIYGGTIQPVSYLKIFDKMDEINATINTVTQNVDKYSISEFISIVAKIHYDLTVLHPFKDGNGRTIRAFTNWLFRLKGLCPIYIDSESRNEYLDALKRIDEGGSTELLQIIFIKSMIRTLAEFHKSW